MRLVLEESFTVRFERQLEFIALDSPVRAQKFGAAMMKAIREVKRRPYLYRQSVFYDHPDVRDLVFKGYTIVFRIKGDSIEVFGLVNRQTSPTD